MRKSLVVLLLASAIAAVAGQSDRTEINLNSDKDGKTNPELFVPIYWDIGLFSGVGYKSSNTFDYYAIDGIDSEIGSMVDQRYFRLNLLTYEYKSSLLTYAVGAEVEQISIDKYEFGYMDFSSDIQAISNDIQIDVLRTNLKGDLTYRTADFYARIGCSLSPVSNLSVEQKTRINPLVATVGTSDATKSQDLAYSLNIKSAYRFHPKMSLIVKGDYSYLPLKYDLAELSGSGPFTFSTVEQDQEEITSSLMVSLAFNIDTFSKELSPSIGFGSRSVTTKDNVYNDENTISESLLIIGFEGRF